LALVLGTTGTAPAQNSASSGPTRVAVVDVAKILKEHPAIQAEVKRIEKELEAYDAELKQKREELRALVENLKTLTAGTPDYTRQEERIAELDSKLRLEMRRKQQELVEAEARIYYDNYQQIAAAVKRIAEYNKIDLVIRYNSEQMDINNQETVIRGVMKNVVYHSSALDITKVTMDLLTQQLAAKPQGGVTK
jgi:Skp family chaperone for outer membrane proteins